ncbi:unnamed protein product [Nippostrongylus brasiliensis]|uniref:LDLR chaperone MESD (inferred by orthology to a human protein) n=1 Tax=Nippostrongylus brasiliensis TaxID=27835 RepID=A0A0N4XUI1_NIPBR|nr:unnamed protein product [Nippostrongylus brasiliensis]
MSQQVTLLFLLWCLASSHFVVAKVKKDLSSYSEADLERLYEEWEKNDPDEDDSEEDVEKKKPEGGLDLKHLKGKSPEDVLRMTKKGQTLMMFVNIRDPKAPSEKNRRFTEKRIGLLQSMLQNNHIQCNVFAIDDDRAIFMFQDGSQAFEAKDVLLKQPEVTEITLEGQQYTGAGAAKQEL